MKLLYITGFPRSSTTYLLNWLRNSVSCFGVREEQGLHVLWDAIETLKEVNYDDVTSSLWKLFPPGATLNREQETYTQAIKLTHWLGVFTWKNMKSIGPSFLDGWCWSALKARSAFQKVLHNSLITKYFVIKTPASKLTPGWPEEYIRQSSIFSDYRVVALARNPEEVLHSGMKKFEHWQNGSVNKEGLYEEWVRMYTEIQKKPSKWLIVNHADLFQDTKNTLHSLADELGIVPGPPREFKATSTDCEHWLDEEQQDEVSRIFNGPNVLKIRPVKGSIWLVVSLVFNRIWHMAHQCYHNNPVLKSIFIKFKIES
jgi:hypothetical protein